MSNISVQGPASSTKPAGSPVDLFNNQSLSDVQVKLGDGERIYGHKQILAQKSDWLFRAFNGNFPVASSNEICLDDEDDNPKAIHTMIRHIYDPSQTLYLSISITDLMFHVNVFTAADKYDVPSLRVLVVKRFAQLMEQKWSTSQQEFCKVIRRLCGPAAARFADPSLQQAAAKVCSNNIKGLIKLGTFVNVLEECGPFAAHLLTTALTNKRVMETYRCQDCISSTGRELERLSGRRCFTCNASQAPSLNGSFGPGDRRRFEPYKSFMEL